MTEPTFAEKFKKDFPELEEYATGENSLTNYDVEQNCLSRSRVKSAILNPKNRMETDIGKIPDIMLILEELGLNDNE